MEKYISLDTSRGHYTADACIIWCFDDRFTAALNVFIKSRNFMHADLVKIAGGAKDVVTPTDESARLYIFDQIAKSIKLHHTPLVVFMAHDECGAYGGTTDPSFYEAELKNANSLVMKQFPEIIVETYFVGFDGVYQVS